MKIIALDPGGTTGWATYDDRVPEGVSKFNMGQIGPDEHHQELDVLLGQQSADDYYVVCESFEYRKGLRDNLVLVSCEYIGVTKLFCVRTSVPLKLQTAAVGKGFFWPADRKKGRTDRLLQLGFNPTYETRHQHDALRHLLQYMMDNNIQKERILRLLK